MRQNFAKTPALIACYAFFGGAAAANAQVVPPVVYQAPDSLSQLGTALAADGISPISQYNGEFAANPIGGARPGQAFTGQFDLGADVDLHKLVGLSGGTIHVLMTDRAGDNLAENSLDNSIPVQQIYGGRDGQTYQLTILTYEQKLFNGLVDIEAGRTDVSVDFIESPFYCDFQSNASCANPSMMGDDTSTTFYPVASWGGRVKFNPSPNVYVKTGIYQSAPTLLPVNDHGFDWGTGHSNGFLLPIEVGYANTTPGAAEPNQYDAGVIFDRTSYSAPFYNASSPERYGRTLAYLQGQQMVYQAAPDSPRGLYVFGVAMYGASGGQQEANFSIEGGAVFQGPFASRPLDTAGILVNDVHYNGRFLNSLYATRAAEGGTAFPRSNLVMLELNYNVQMTPWLGVMPNFQYVINPDGLGSTQYPRANEKNAVVFGLQFVIDAAKLLGLSSS